MHKKVRDFVKKEQGGEYHESCLLQSTMYGDIDA